MKDKIKSIIVLDWIVDLYNSIISKIKENHQGGETGKTITRGFLFSITWIVILGLLGLYLYWGYVDLFAALIALGIFVLFVILIQLFHFFGGRI